ncbi:hypothetical protein IFT73_11925, partial [Aeromicrobium sp. CFBP 8757]|uniref:hypothetical protein n=1 Tax=Aeromicrobium sp. CFBP 8757 TaxID=2775288 RepID=UPI00177D5E10
MGEKSEQADHELSAPSPCDNTPDDVSDLDVNVVEDQGDGPSRELLRAELAQPFSAVVNAGPSEETVHSVVDFKMPTIGTGGGRSVLATSTLSQLIKTAGRSTIGMDTVAALGHAGGPASAFTTGLGAPSISARALGLTTPSISARALGLTTPSISARA